MSDTLSHRIKEVFRILYGTFGQQGWWPLSGPDRTGHAERRPLLVPKHHNGPPVSDQDILEIMIGAILTQNTAWTNVEKAIAMLNEQKMLSLDALEEVKQEDLAVLIRSAGYFNQKAKKLKALVAFLKDHPIAGLKQVPLKRLRSLLLSINGVGPETADCMLLYGLGKGVFVVDAYTRRIGARVGFLSGNESYEEIRELFETAVCPDVFGQYHALLVMHAKTTCKKIPICKDCPIAFCSSRQFFS